MQQDVVAKDFRESTSVSDPQSIQRLQVQQSTERLANQNRTRLLQEEQPNQFDYSQPNPMFQKLQPIQKPLENQLIKT
jgi:hypothetical protein